MKHSILAMDLGSSVESDYKLRRKHNCMRVTTPMAEEVVSHMTPQAATTGATEKAVIYLWVLPLKQNAGKAIWKDHIPGFKTFWIAQFLFRTS